MDKEYCLYAYKPTQRLGEAFIRAYLNRDEAIRCARLYIENDHEITEVEVYAHWNAGNKPRFCCIFRERQWRETAAP